MTNIGLAIISASIALTILLSNVKSDKQAKILIRVAQGATLLAITFLIIVLVSTI